MTPDDIAALRSELEEKEIGIGRPLSPAELEAIEELYGFSFPADLRLLLSTFVPLGDDFPDWYSPTGQDLIEWFDYPVEGIAFDVEENGYWREEWGERPEALDDAADEARRQVALAPILIPLYAHRFLPSRPVESGNPVFSVSQSDVVVYAADLGWWFREEFGTAAPKRKRHRPREIAFWSALAGAE